MKKRTKRNKTDILFNGHLEKPVSKMTPEEKINYLWLQMEFKYHIGKRKFYKIVPKGGLREQHNKKVIGIKS